MAGVDAVTWRSGTTTRREAKRLLQMAEPLARGKALGIGFCGRIDRVLKTHLDLMMNVKMFLVPFNSDLLGGKALEMSCSGIPWICSWTSEFCGRWPRLRQGGGECCEAFKIAPLQNSWLCPTQQTWAVAAELGSVSCLVCSHTLCHEAVRMSCNHTGMEEGQSLCPWHLTFLPDC